MTDDELMALMALPDVTPTLRQREVFTIDGRRATVPMAGGGYDGELLYLDNGPRLVTDSDGNLWQIGYMPYGKRVRRLAP